MGNVDLSRITDFGLLMVITSNDTHREMEQLVHSSARRDQPIKYRNGSKRGIWRAPK